MCEPWPATLADLNPFGFDDEELEEEAAAAAAK